MDEEYVQEHILTKSTPQAIRTYPARWLSKGHDDQHARRRVDKAGITRSAAVGIAL
jgi:hypothetical protein